MEPNIEEGITHYMDYIRIMSLLTDDQLTIIIGAANTNAYMAKEIGIEGYIDNIRKMSMYSNSQLREYLRQSIEDPAMLEIFKDFAKKKIRYEKKISRSDS